MGILVKQEGECAPPGWPKFSKIRGVVAHIASRPESVIGVLDTYHSKAGWAVALACAAAGKECVNFWPRRKSEKGDPPKPQQMKAEEAGATLFDLQAGMSAVLFNQSKKILRETWGEDSYMMPNALKLEESVDETRKEISAMNIDSLCPEGVDNVLVSISSGTIAAGVILGLAESLFEGRIILHMGYSRPEAAVRKYLDKYLGDTSLFNIEFVDEGFSYADKVDTSQIPFPCNEYYDAKAWNWLRANGLEGKTLFVNIGE